MCEPVDMRHVEILGHDRYQERLRSAMRVRPVCMAPSAGSRFGRCFCQSMAWMGRKLTALGWSLQERFDQARPVSAA
jgi:hypothetical protein